MILNINNVRTMRMAMVAVLSAAAIANLAGCDTRNPSTTHQRASHDENILPIAKKESTAESDRKPAGTVEMPTVPVADTVISESEQSDSQLPAEDVASGLTDEQITLRQAMKELAEILEASQRLQRKLFDAPKHFSAPSSQPEEEPKKNEKKG